MIDQTNLSQSKAQVISWLIDALTSKHTAYLHESKIHLAKESIKDLPNSEEITTVWYRGDVSHIREASPTRAVNLPLEAVEPFKFILDQIKENESNANTINQALILLLRHCKSDQEVLDNLPDFLHPYLPVNEHYVRKNPPLYLIKDEPRSIKIFERAITIIQHYEILNIING